MMPIFWFAITFLVFGGGPTHQVGVAGPFASRHACEQYRFAWENTPSPPQTTNTLSVCTPGRRLSKGNPNPPKGSMGRFTKPKDPKVTL